MAILPILHYPDPRLRQRAEPVTTFDTALRQLVDDMAETMYSAPGVGLAAPQVGVSRRLFLVDIADEHRRDAAMAALITTPPAASCADILGIPPGRGRWLSVLHAAGVVTDGRATPRGVMCIAADGHFCRSLGERSIDDWLSARGVEHGTEPSWPEHPEWNRAGLKRADWLLPGGVYVEYAGMLDDTAYAERMASKVALAQATGIELLILTPADIPRLDSVLDRWASGPQTRV